MRPSRWGSLVVVAGLLYAALVAIPTPVAAAAPRHASGGELVAVGQDESIVLSVNAETAADLVGVEILIPDGFTPDPSRPPDAKGGGVGGVFLPWQAQFLGIGATAPGGGARHRRRRAGAGDVLGNRVAARDPQLRHRDPRRRRHIGSLGRCPERGPPGGRGVRRPIVDRPVAHAGVGNGCPIILPPAVWAAGAAGVAGLALLGAVVAGRRHRRPAGPSGTEIRDKVSIRGSGNRR